MKRTYKIPLTATIEVDAFEGGVHLTIPLTVLPRMLKHGNWNLYPEDVLKADVEEVVEAMKESPANFEIHHEMRGIGS